MDWTSFGRVRTAMTVRDYDIVMLALTFDEGIEEPTTDGFDWIRKLRSQPGFPEMIILAEGGSELAAIRTLRLGAADYLPKRLLTPPRLQRSIKLTLRAIEKEAQRRAERLAQAATADPKPAKAEAAKADAASAATRPSATSPAAHRDAGRRPSPRSTRHETRAGPRELAGRLARAGTPAHTGARPRARRRAALTARPAPVPSQNSNPAPRVRRRSGRRLDSGVIKEPKPVAPENHQIPGLHASCRRSASPKPRPCTSRSPRISATTSR